LCEFSRVLEEIKELGRLRVKTRTRSRVSYAFLRVDPIFVWGLRVLRVARNLRLFTRKTRNLPSTLFLIFILQNTMPLIPWSHIPKRHGGVMLQCFPLLGTFFYLIYIYIFQIFLLFSFNFYLNIYFY